MCALITPELAPCNVMKSPRLSATSLAGSRWRSSQQRRVERGTSQGGGWMSMLWMWALKAFVLQKASSSSSSSTERMDQVSRKNYQTRSRISNDKPILKRGKCNWLKKICKYIKYDLIWSYIYVFVIPKFSRPARLTWHDGADTSARVGLAARAAAICACMAAIALASLARRRSRTSGCAKFAWRWWMYTEESCIFMIAFGGKSRFFVALSSVITLSLWILFVWNAACLWVWKWLKKTGPLPPKRNKQSLHVQRLR